MMTRKQKRREVSAKSMEDVERRLNLKPLIPAQLRATNRRVEKRKRLQKRRLQ